MLLSTPIEVLHQIVLAAAIQSPLGPPTTLLALLLTCRQLSLSLSHNVSPILYTRLFAILFDPHAPARRLSFLPNNTIVELRRRCVALKLLRNKIYTPNALLAEALLIVLFMLTEDDGRNAEQLRWAGLHRFINYFVRNNIFNGAHKNNGWPLENEINSLVMNISWYLTSRDSLASESEHDRQLTMCALRPFVYAAFRYPSTVGPDNHFNLLDSHLPTPQSNVHGPYPPPCIKPKSFVYFGQPITVRLSPIAIIAILSYFARLDPVQLSLPPQLPPTRAAAISAGRHGLTQEDIIHFNTQPRIHFPGSHSTHLFGRQKSTASDYYWSWMLSPSLDSISGPSSLPYSQIYIPGALSGHWQGASSTPDVFVYQNWLSHVNAPSEFDDFGILPLYFTLQEHFCYSPSSAVPLDDSDNGFINAWLPPGCKVIHHEKGLEIYDDRGTFKSFYETYRPGVDDGDGDPFARYRGVIDVIVTGKTDDRRGEAWGMFKYTGRVRLSDGLAVLLREPMNPDVSGWNVLLRGFVTSSLNFVGRWRGVARGDAVADLETVFVVCKREEP